MDSEQKDTHLFGFDASKVPRNGASGVMTCSPGFLQGVLPGFGGFSPVNFNVLLPEMPDSATDETGTDGIGTEIVGHESLATTTPFVTARSSVDEASLLKFREPDLCNALHDP